MNGACVMRSTKRMPLM